MKNKLIIMPLVMISIILAFGLPGCASQTTPTPTSSATPSVSAPVTSTVSQTSVPPSTTAAVKTSAPPAVPASSTSATTVSNLPSTRMMTDMYGRTIFVPNPVNRVLTSGPVEMELVYMLAPEKLAGLSFTFNGKPPLVPDKYAKLPVVGGWFGTQTGNYETYIAAKPDVVLEGTQTSIPDRQLKFGNIPVVGVNAGDTLKNYEDEIRFLGDLLDAKAQADSLIAYYKDAMQYVGGIVSKIPEADKIKVYYAEGNNGFSTDPVGSQHTLLLEFCGGKNVAQVTLKPGYGMADASLEQIIIWNPDMIIIGRGSQASLYTTITTDPRWSQLTAVKNKKVAIRPDNPLSWFDGPPGPGQILGMYWMVNKLYPEQTKDLDLKAKMKEFYSKFFHYEVSDQEVAKLLANPS